MIVKRNLLDFNFSSASPLSLVLMTNWIACFISRRLSIIKISVLRDLHVSLRSPCIVLPGQRTRVQANVQRWRHHLQVELGWCSFEILWQPLWFQRVFIFQELVRIAQDSKVHSGFSYISRRQSFLIAWLSSEPFSCVFHENLSLLLSKGWLENRKLGIIRGFQCITCSLSQLDPLFVLFIWNALWQSLSLWKALSLIHNTSQVVITTCYSQASRTSSLGFHRILDSATIDDQQWWSLSDHHSSPNVFFVLKKWMVILISLCLTQCYIH